MRSGQRALLALALIAIALGAAAALHSNAAAQTTNTIGFEILRTEAAGARIVYFGHPLVPLDNDQTITGKVTLRVKSDEWVQRVGTQYKGLLAADFTATGATLSNFRHINWWDTWLIDVTPTLTASGPVTVNIQAGVVQGYQTQHQSMFNAGRLGHAELRGGSAQGALGRLQLARRPRGRERPARRRLLYRPHRDLQRACHGRRRADREHPHPGWGR